MTENKLPISRRKALGILGAALVTPQTALASNQKVLSGHAFGTTWQLIVQQDDDLSKLARKIANLFDEIDQVFSPWRADSAISRFNALPAKTMLPDLQLAHVTTEALVIARQSDGAFDPTVGPLVARWGFGPIHKGGAPDWRGIETGPKIVSKSRNGLTLDLCGIAKGWALDRAAACIKSSGVGEFLFELGGEFIARGRRFDGRDWRLAIDTPTSFATAPPVLRLPNGFAVATSGVWAQSYRLTDSLYSHIIDSATARPISGALRSVTVVASNATMADGWATALCAAGEETGPDLARKMGLAALFLVEDANTLRQIETGPIRDFLI